MTYRILIGPAAQRDLRSLPRKILRQVDAKILALAHNPRPPGSKKLEGGQDLWRIRSGDFRILYQIHDDILRILVVRVGNRRDVYRGV